MGWVVSVRLHHGGFDLASRTYTTVNPATGSPLLINSREARAVLSIGQRKLWTLVNMNAIPHRRVDRSIRFVPSELHAWIACNCPTHPGAADRVRTAAK